MLDEGFENLNKNMEGKIKGDRKNWWVRPRFKDESEGTLIQAVDKEDELKMGLRFQLAAVDKQLVSVKRIFENGEYSCVCAGG